MKKTHRILFLLYLFSGSLFAQQDSVRIKLNSFVRNINTFNNLYPQEKVYLHFDNTGYYLGETIWFKAYLATAENNRLSGLSKVLYVELLTPEGDIVETKKLKIENGQAHGEFALKDIPYAGFFEVRAYTKSMLNFGEEGIFSRVFPIYDLPRKEGVFLNKKMSERPRHKNVLSFRQKTDKPNNIDITFYPEAGNLITGLSNRIAFKAVDKQGKSLNVSGTIYDSKGEEVTSFSTTYQGMGSFVMYPDGQKYTAKVIAGEKETTVVLPAGIARGYSLYVDNYQSQELRIQLAKSPGLPIDTLGITFACRGRVYAFKTFCVTDDQPSLFHIPKSIFPTGVAQITVFNSRGEVLADRLAFINHDEASQIKTEMNASFAPFSPVNINFKLEDKPGNPLETTFSLSVRDKGTEVKTGYTDNIQTNLLLSSELKGYIENPGYYFEKQDMKHIVALDLLMMTQGWRRYSWKQMAGMEPFVVKHGIEKGLIVEGKVLSVIKKKEKENIEVTMWMLTPYQKGTCVTDKNGTFNMELDDFYGKTDLNLETRENGKLKDYRILLDRVFSPTPKAYTFGEINLNEITPLTEKQVLEEKPITDKTPESSINPDSIANTHALGEVTVTEKKQWKREQEGGNQADVIIHVSKELDKIRDKGESEAGGVLEFIAQQHNRFSYNVDGFDDKLSCNYMGKDVLFVINNSLAKIAKENVIARENYNNYDIANPVNDKIYLSVSDLDISTIESIMISQNSNSATGYCPNCDPKDYTVIFIYTKKEGRSVDKTGTRKTSLEGYSKISEFYSPTYKGVGLPDEKDFRRTLYWNPDVKTDKEGNASVIFYNNKTCKSVTVSSEGITKDGNLIK